MRRGRLSGYVAISLEQPLNLVPPTAHIDAGLYWWLDQPRLARKGRVVPGVSPELLPEAEGEE